MSDTLHLECPGCHEMLEVDAGFIGGVCRCAHCGAVMSVDGTPSAGLSASRRSGRSARPDRPGGSGSQSSNAFDDIRTARVLATSGQARGGGSGSRSSRSSQRSASKAKGDKPGGMPIVLAAIGGACIFIGFIVVGSIVLLGGGQPQDNTAPPSDTAPPVTNDNGPGNALSGSNPWRTGGDATDGPNTTNEQTTADDRDGLVLAAAWEFNNNADDSAPTGSPLNGKLMSGAKIVDGRLILDGEDDHLEVPVGPGLNDGGSRLRIDIRFLARDPGRAKAKQVLLDVGGAERGLNVYFYNGRLYCGGYNLPGDPESGWEGNWLQTDAVRPNRWYTLRLELDAGNTPIHGGLNATLDGQSLGSAVGAKIWPNTSWNGIGSARQNTRYHNGVSSEPSPFAGEIDFIRVYRGE